MGDELIVRGRWIVTGGGGADPTLADGALVVAGERIAELGDWTEIRARYPAAEVIGSERVAVLPGLINAHHHSSGVTALQQGLPDALLESWILMHARLRPEDKYLGTLLSAARLLGSGVTSVVEVHSGAGTAEDYAARMDRALGAYEETGLRVAFGAGISDQSHLVAGRGEDEAFVAALPEGLRAEARGLLPGPGRVDQDAYFGIMADARARYGDHPLIDIWFAPPGPQWVSDGFMQRIAEQAAAWDSGIQTHLEESFYEKLHGPRDYGRATLAHLKELGVLGPRFSIAHGVWLSEAEIEILCETGTAISHNPSSNLRLRAGIAPLNALLAAGATVGLGMDGTTLNDDEDMFTEMRLAMRLNRPPRYGAPAPAPAEVLELATAGGARLLRREDRLGKLAPGYLADLVLVDLGRTTWPWVAPEIDPRELILMRARAGDVDCVLVGGRVVFAEGKPSGFDAADAGRELAGSLAAAAYPAAEADLVKRLLPHLEAYYAAWAEPDLEPYTTYNSRR
jgi:cytosine/adenosine deaminase-related metal-dependent hydrolase